MKTSNVHASHLECVHLCCLCINLGKKSIGSIRIASSGSRRPQRCELKVESLKRVKM